MHECVLIKFLTRLWSGGSNLLNGGVKPLSGMAEHRNALRARFWGFFLYFFCLERSEMTVCDLRNLFQEGARLRHFFRVV